MARYSKIAVLIHWLTALMIVTAFALGVTVANMEGFSKAKLEYIAWHKWLGVTVLGFSCLRLLWRLLNKPPAYEVLLPAWQHRAASAIHVLLYVLIFAVPLSGYFYSLAAGYPVVYLKLITLPVLIDKDPVLKPLLEQLHFSLNMILLACFILHVGAALKHLIVDRDGIFQRMLP